MRLCRPARKIETLQTGGEREKVYVPEAFKESRLDVLHAFMRANPFATLVTNGVEGPVVIHLPTLFHSELGRHGTLHAHAARANHDVPAGDAGVPALFVFQGSHAYISPSWYPSKLLHGRVVPSWNYIAVHVRGTLKLHSEPDWLLGHLQQLTDSQEKHRDHPWFVSDAPKAYTDALVGHIVGLEFEITSIAGKWKLGQNRSIDDQKGVITGLQAEASPSAHAVAASMQQHLDSRGK